jgi:hypothetical protein
MRLVAIAAMLVLGACSLTASQPEAPKSAVKLVVVPSRAGPLATEYGDSRTPDYMRMGTIGAYADAYMAQNLPPALRGPKTELVLSTGDTRGYLNGPLCQKTPTLHLTWTSGVWGRALYENANGLATDLLRSAKLLVDSNCAPGQVESILLAVFQPIHYLGPLDDTLYVDRYDSTKYRRGERMGRYVYYGVIVPNGKSYALLHQDPNGMERYMKQNAGDEAMYARMRAHREAELRLQREGIGAVVSDFCQLNPVACGAIAVGVVSTLIRPGTSTNTSQAPHKDVGSCLAQCLSQPAQHQAFCQAACYGP